MTVQKTELREAVVAILSNYGNAPYPTIAGANVFDSKMDDISNNGHDSKFPIINVFTDSQISIPMASANGWPLENTVEIIIELSMASDRSGISTNRDLERNLDLLESQVLNSLFEVGQNGAVNEAAISLAKMYSKISRIASFRMSNTEHGHRIAMKGLQIELTYNARCIDAVSALPRLKSVSMKVDAGNSSPPIKATADTTV